MTHADQVRLHHQGQQTTWLQKQLESYTMRYLNCSPIQANVFCNSFTSLIRTFYTNRCRWFTNRIPVAWSQAI